MRLWFYEKLCDLFFRLDWGDAYQWAGKKLFEIDEEINDGKDNGG